MENLQYKIEKRGTGFQVFPVKESDLRRTTITQAGVEFETIPVSRVIPGYEDDVFWCYHNGGDEWWTDINCGMQRWHGYKTTREIRAALRKCGFPKATIDQTIKEARKAA